MTHLHAPDLSGPYPGFCEPRGCDGSSFFPGSICRGFVPGPRSALMFL
jgi:hypothetical protein